MAKYSNREVSTIQGAINYGMSQQVRCGTYHAMATIMNDQTGDVIKVPSMSLLNKYRWFLQEIVPMRFCFYFYVTTYYWAALIEKNTCLRIIDYTNN